MLQSIYRTSPPPPEPRKKRWACRMGFHNLVFQHFGYVATEIVRCNRPACGFVTCRSMY